MNRLIAIAVLALVFTGTSAHAEGRYFSANLGLSMFNDADVSALGLDLGEISFEPGFNIGGAVGHIYGNFRAEFEITYRQANMDQFTVPGTIPGCPCSGTQPGWASALSFMGNGYYDFHSSDSPLAPYLGAGFGMAIVYGDIGLGTVDSDTVPGFQLMAGIGYDINPNTILTVGYRYFSALTDPEFPIFGVPVEFQCQVTNLMLVLDLDFKTFYRY